MAQFVFQGSETVSPSFYKKTQVLGGSRAVERWLYRFSRSGVCFPKLLRAIRSALVPRSHGRNLKLGK